MRSSGASGPARFGTLAQACYAETDAARAAREKFAEQSRLVSAFAPAFARAPRQTRPARIAPAARQGLTETAHAHHDQRANRLFIFLAGFFLTNALIAEFVGVKIFALEATWARVRSTGRCSESAAP